jgi:hypothetical protein
MLDSPFAFLFWADAEQFNDDFCFSGFTNSGSVNNIVQLAGKTHAWSSICILFWADTEQFNEHM